MTISAKVIEDSISPEGIRLCTMQVTFHRFILPEFNTHRVFSRNFSSSRAIPTKKLIEQVRSNPAMPVHWGANEPGMQANKELTGQDLEAVKQQWLISARLAADMAEQLSAYKAHKQIVNRVLEPYLYVTGIVTATELDNFFELRDHEDAQPEIQALARAMKAAMAASTPKLLQPGEWHLPYISEEERNDPFFKIPVNKFMLQKISAARCCRVSYLKQNGEKPSIDDDLELCQRLVGARPLHASPFEHQGTPMYLEDAWRLQGNFNGW